MQASTLLVLALLAPVSAIKLREEASKSKFAYVTVWLKKDVMPPAALSNSMSPEEELEYEQQYPEEKANRMALQARLAAQVSEEALDADVPKGGAKAYGPKFIFEMDDNLRASGSKYPLVVVTNDPEMVQNANLTTHREIKIVQMGDSPTDKLHYVKRTAKLTKRNAVHWHKLAIFKMTEYEKLIYMDMDTKVKKNIDHIFTDEKFITDDGNQVWGIVNDFSCNSTRVRADYFNSAIMLLEPKEEKFDEMLEFAQGRRFWGDQAVIQAYFDENKIKNYKNGTKFRSKVAGKKRHARLFPTKMADFNGCHKKVKGTNSNGLEVEHHR